MEDIPEVDDNILGADAVIYAAFMYRVIHLKCPKRQALRRVEDAFNPPSKFAM